MSNDWDNVKVLVKVCLGDVPYKLYILPRTILLSI